MEADLRIYNATEVWQREISLPSIATFSQQLDKILGGNGLPLCSVIEVLGLPGTGKTQLCLQLCASIQVPRALGGLESSALYIDTNTNFTIERFRDILIATLNRCQSLLDLQFPINVENALKKLHYVNAFGLEEFSSFICCLPKFLNEHANIKLIVIDSITFPFKGITARKRTGLLFRLIAEIQKVAFLKQIAVVLTNEMSTRVGLSGGSIVGALGDAWSYRCNTRLLLANDPYEGRQAALLKCNLNPNAAVKFQITHEGIRDVE